MVKRKINIEILGEDLPLQIAVDCVAKVIAKGRISGEGNCFCYVSTRKSPDDPDITVEAKNNPVKQDGDYSTSDSFKVYYAL